MPERDSEIEVGEDLARTLIAAQFSELDVTSLRRVGEGWDNTVWATGDDIAFRFPRREIAIPGVKRKMVFLPKTRRSVAGSDSRRYPRRRCQRRLPDGSLAIDPMERADMRIHVPITRAALGRVAPSETAMSRLTPYWMWPRAHAGHRSRHRSRHSSRDLN